MKEAKHTPRPWTFSVQEQFGEARFYVAQAEGAPFTTLELQDAVTQVVELAFSRHMDKVAELFSGSVGFEQLRKFYKKAEMLKAQAAHELYHAVNVDGVLIIKNTFKV